jgi:hypothetical protein
MANDSLQKKIEAFMDVWGTKLGDSALKAVNDVVDYGGTQETGLQASGIMKFDANGFTYGLQLVGRDGKPYWQYIEYGVDGTVKKHGSRYKFKDNKPIPKAAALNFIEKRNITLKSLKAYGRKNFEGISLKSRKKVRKTLKDLTFEQERETLSFIIGRSIKKKGIKPRPFIDKIMTPELQKELKQGLANIYKEEIISTFKTGL